MHKGIIGLVVVLLIGSLIVSVWNQSNVSTVENCKVTDGNFDPFFERYPKQETLQQELERLESRIAEIKKQLES